MYLNNNILEQGNSINYLGIIFDIKITFRDHVINVEEKCTKLVFSFSKSAKVTWRLKHESLKTMYTRGMLPIILYGVPVWKSVLDIKSYKDKLIRIQRLINTRIAKAYRTVSNEALCVITGLTPINLKIEETAQYYEYIEGYGNLINWEIEEKYWKHPANFVKITEGKQESKHTIYVYAGGSKGEDGVGSGIAILTDSNITDIKIQIKRRCSNNQAEKLAILKHLKIYNKWKPTKEQ